MCRVKDKYKLPEPYRNTNPVQGRIHNVFAHHNCGKLPSEACDGDDDAVRRLQLVLQG